MSDIVHALSHDFIYVTGLSDEDSKESDFAPDIIRLRALSIGQKKDTGYRAIPFYLIIADCN